MNKIQIIYTLEMGQKVINLPYPEIAIQTIESFIEWAKSVLYGHSFFLKDSWKEEALKSANKEGDLHIPEEMPELPIIVKISCCLIRDNNEKILVPDWYNECHGKIYKNTLNPSMAFDY